MRSSAVTTAFSKQQSFGSKQHCWCNLRSLQKVFFLISHSVRTSSLKISSHLSITNTQVLFWIPTIYLIVQIHIVSWSLFRYTLLVDRHSAIIASCLKDPSTLVRKQTLMLLTHLIKEQFVRWAGQVIYIYWSCEVES